MADVNEDGRKQLLGYLINERRPQQETREWVETWLEAWCKAPRANPEPQYYDIDGKPVSLDELCRIEPAWAANRIRVMREQLEPRANAGIKAGSSPCQMTADLLSAGERLREALVDCCPGCTTYIDDWDSAVRDAPRWKRMTAPRANPEPGASDGREVSSAVEACLRILEDPDMHNAGKGQAVHELATRLRGLQPNVWATAPGSVSPALTPRKCRQCGDTFTWVSYDETRCLGCHSEDDWQGEVQDCLHRAVDDPHEPSVDALVDAVVVLTHQIGRLERKRPPASPARAEPAGCWLPFDLTDDDCPAVDEGEAAWIVWEGVVQEVPYTWGTDDRGTLGWNVIGMHDAVTEGVTHYQRIVPPVPPAPQSQHPSEVESWRS